MHPVKFSPSLMCLDIMNAGDQIRSLSQYCDYMHVDIMDGHFAPNLTLGPDFVKAARSCTSVPLEIHMMCEQPSMWIRPVIEAGANIVSLHAETISRDAFRQLNLLNSLGVKAGVVLNPATPLSDVRAYIERLDLVTIMTVDVGFAGQPFIEEMLPKIEAAAELKANEGLRFELQIDGSCNKRTFKKLRDAGAEIFILGNSGLFSKDADIDTAWKLMSLDYEAQTGESL
ncbi:D-allulose 6-phosphate 3-epimerase [Acidipropionibacterium timonense]|uniref:D-allulose 6-phosphate 3-epimerase n=1 Tax=Acidipropionibacterium timonense TaxID=2161818 RepID=UPI00103250BD|nr:D-allulose 6-phosphate 3-epimerase [Acidipropionibacterium timonense]